MAVSYGQQKRNLIAHSNSDIRHKQER